MVGCLVILILEIYIVMKWTTKAIASFIESKGIGERHFQDLLGLTKKQVESVIENGTQDEKFVQILDWIESNAALDGAIRLQKLKELMGFNNPQMAAYLGWGVSKFNRALRGDSYLESSEARYINILLDSKAIRENIGNRKYG